MLENLFCKKKKKFKDILSILISSPFLFLRLFLKKISYVESNKFKYKYIFSAGKLLENKFKGKGKIIKIHHYDLDFFNEAKKFNEKKNYILFISPATLNPDVYDNNPGYRHKNILNFKNKQYFFNINNFLNSLKSITKLDILVAKHPKDNYNLEKNLKFKCYKNITAELVKNSKFVLCFDTSAFQFAILANKPIIFLTSDLLPKLVKDDILTRCHFFNKSPININKTLDRQQILNNLKVNKKIYRKYESLFISNTSKIIKQKKSCKIIYDFIKKA